MNALELDRITPTRRPDRVPTGVQSWRDLLFMHWSLPPDVMRPLVPAAIDLDLWDGRAWVGLVPFRMEGVRPSWLPQSLALSFPELNVRTYVHFRGRPAVWFLSLEAASFLAVHAARLGWSLPYHHARMNVARTGDRVHYTSERRSHTRCRCEVEYEIGARLGPSVPGTFQFFLLERYLLLSVRRGVVYEGQVHHPPYVAHEAMVTKLEDGLIAASGLPGVTFPPEAVHGSPGVDVEVFGPWQVG